MKYPVRVALILSAAAIVGGVASYFYVPYRLRSYSLVNRGHLKQIAEKKRAGLPKILDDGTEMYGIEARGDTLVYSFRLVMMKAGTGEFEDGFPHRHYSVLHWKCNEFAAKVAFFAAGYCFRYEYADKNKAPLGKITVSKAVCDSLKAEGDR